MTYREISCGVIPPGMVSGDSTDMTIALDPQDGEHATVRVDAIVVRPC